MTVRNPQLRYIVRGSKGTYIKYGVDPQEQQLKDGMDMVDDALGIEAPEIQGKLELLGPDGGITIERCAHPVVQPKGQRKRSM